MYIRLTESTWRLEGAQKGDVCKVSRQLGSLLVRKGKAEAVTPEEAEKASKIVPEATPLEPIMIKIKKRRRRRSRKKAPPPPETKPESAVPSWRTRFETKEEPPEETEETLAEQRKAANDAIAKAAEESTE